NSVPPSADWLPRQRKSGWLLSSIRASSGGMGGLLGQEGLDQRREVAERRTGQPLDVDRRTAQLLEEQQQVGDLQRRENPALEQRRVVVKLGGVDALAVLENPGAQALLAGGSRAHERYSFGCGHRPISSRMRTQRRCTSSRRARACGDANASRAT